MSAMQSEKGTGDRQNKDIMNDPRGLIVLQTQLAFFSGLIHSSHVLILNKAKSFCVLVFKNARKIRHFRSLPR